MTTSNPVSRRRRRRLAADDRAGRLARLRYREAYRAYLRAQWKVLLLGGVLFLGVTAAVALVVRAPIARGLIIGFGVTATAAALTHLVVLASGSAPLMMGELAEQWTAGHLRSLQASGWRVVNHFGLRVGDIDHVVIGPPGVFVVETKWSASAWTKDWAKEDVANAERQAAENAKVMGLWENYKRLGLPAPVPLVALWGSGAADLAGSLGRTGVFAGGDVAPYLRGQELVDARLQAEQIERALRVLDDHLQKRDADEAAKSPMPESIEALAARFTACVIAGLMSFIAAGYLLKTGLPLWGWFVVLATVGALDHVLRRWHSLRSFATGSQTGLVAAAILVAAVSGSQLLR